jgi:acetyltransferase-like isoleucine patch superfamily enzyme
MRSLIGHYSSRVMQKIDRARWLAEQRRAGSRVHRSLEVTGLQDVAARVRLAPGCWIERDVTIWLSPDQGAEPRLTLGGEAFIGRNSYIGLFQPVSIGSCTIVGAYSYIISASHRYDRRDIPIKHQGFTGSAISIADDVWIGTGVTVLPGVAIGRGAIVAAGSVVNRDVPEYEIWGGMPARFLKARP